MNNLIAENPNTNENEMEIDEEKKHETSQCLLILLSLALSCMRKLKVGFKIIIIIQKTKGFIFCSIYIRNLWHLNFYV